MIDIKKHVFPSGQPIIRAINKLNQIEENLTLFILDDHERVVGTLTDGDFRRGLLKGHTMDMEVDRFMSTDFYYLRGEIDVVRIKQLKEKEIKLVPCLDEEKRILEIYDLSKLHSILPVHAVIMAGGRGERLRPLTDKKPKPLLPLGEHPMIYHTYRGLKKYGIRYITISIGYLGDQIKRYFSEIYDEGIDFIEEQDPLGTIGALSLKHDFKSEYILVTNSDQFTNIDYEDLFLNMLQNHSDLAVASVPYTVNIPYAIFEKDKDRIWSFQEKPSSTYYANAGIYIFKRELLKLIPPKQFFNATDFIGLLLEQGCRVIDNIIAGYWIDIGRMDDYLKAQEMLRHIKYD